MLTLSTVFLDFTIMYWKLEFFLVLLSFIGNLNFSVCIVQPHSVQFCCGYDVVSCRRGASLLGLLASEGVRIHLSCGCGFTYKGVSTLLAASEEVRITKHTQVSFSSCHYTSKSNMFLKYDLVKLFWY